jgi:MoaA/NifB/PqqE/SkfB family radical SAM enzyme
MTPPGRGILRKCPSFQSYARSAWSNELYVGDRNRVDEMNLHCCAANQQEAYELIVNRRRVRSRRRREVAFREILRRLVMLHPLRQRKETRDKDDRCKYFSSCIANEAIIACYRKQSWFRFID